MRLGLDILSVRVKLRVTHCVCEVRVRVKVRFRQSTRPGHDARMSQRLTTTIQTLMLSAKQGRTGSHLLWYDPARDSTPTSQSQGGH